MPRKRRRNSIWRQPFIQLLVAGIVVVSGFLVVRTTAVWLYARPFQGKLKALADPYGLSSLGLTSEPYFAGKGVVIDRVDRVEDTYTISSRYAWLPAPYRAKNPEEVRMVVVVDCGGTDVVGSYGSGGRAYLRYCHVTLIDQHTRRIVLNKVFSGEPPPATIYVDPGETQGDAYGSAPDESEMEDYIRSLLGRSEEGSTSSKE
jgi:hypothetical protein